MVLYIDGMLIKTFSEAILMKIAINSGITRLWCLL